MDYNLQLENNIKNLNTLIYQADNIATDKVILVDEVTKSLIDGTITSLTYDGYEAPSEAFRNCINLTHADLLRCEALGSWAFENCHSLSSINLPKLETGGYGVFANCFNLSFIELPEFTGYNGMYSYTYNEAARMFYNNYKLSTALLPLCSYAFWSMFYNCSNLTTISMPNCRFIHWEAFVNCIKLSNINFPRCETIGEAAFSNCTQLQSVNLEQCLAIGNLAFNNCLNLSSLTLQSCLSIQSQAFDGCEKLSYLQLEAPIMCELMNINAFSSTPFQNLNNASINSPLIYVPYNLLDTYKSATNWVQFSNCFRPIPGSESWETPPYIKFTISGTPYYALEGMTWAEWINSDFSSAGWEYTEGNVVYWSEFDYYWRIRWWYDELEFEVEANDIISSEIEYEQYDPWRVEI